jgi:uncharacterized protein DUF2630
VRNLPADATLNGMSDPEIQHRIKALIDEEHRLRESLSGGEITPAEEQERLRAVEVELDQCWDLLRQRRARRSAGQDEGDTAVRPPSTVEGYRQ